MRAVKGQPKALPAKKVLYETNLRDFTYEHNLMEDQRLVMKRILDPTKLVVPATMVLPGPSAAFEDPVVRSGSTHAEALIEFLRSLHAAGVVSPLGFAAASDTRYGLPVRFGRIPGRDLDGARAIFEAFDCQSPTADAALLPKSTIQEGLGLVPTARSSSVDEQATIMAAVRATGQENVWDALPLAKAAVSATVDGEEWMVTQSGHPYFLDDTDVFDPDGKQYRKLADAVEPWNRPVLQEYYERGPEGQWKSTATVTQKLLGAFDPE